MEGEGAVSLPDSVELADLGLPSDRSSLVRYLANSYKGVGEKTAQRLVEEFGADLFRVLHEEPKRLQSVIRADRVDRLLQGWKSDLVRRLERMEEGGENQGDKRRGEEGIPPRRRTRRGARGRSRSGGETPEGTPS